ncbi:alpha/beta fold hydrolase [Streptomyces sp. CA-100214]
MIKRGYVNTPGGQVHYRIQPEGEGSPLALFHFNPSSSESYESLMRELAGKVPTVAFDTVNSGQSFRSIHEPTIEFIGEVMLQALSGLGIEEFHTFGHHTGANVALEVAHAAPERTISATLNGIVSLDTPEERKLAIDAVVWQNPIDARGGQVTRAWDRTTSLSGSKGGKRLPADLLNRELINILTAGPDWAWGYLAAFNDDVATKMNRITCPVFFVIGEHDGSMTHHIREAERHPEHPSHIGAGYGAFYSELAPDILAPKLVEFLRRAEASS